MRVCVECGARVRGCVHHRHAAPAIKSTPSPRADLAGDVGKLVYVDDLLDPHVVGPVVDGRRVVDEDGLAVVPLQDARQLGGLPVETLRHELERVVHVCLAPKVVHHQLERLPWAVGGCAVVHGGEIMAAKQRSNQGLEGERPSSARPLVGRVWGPLADTKPKHPLAGAQNGLPQQWQGVRLPAAGCMGIAGDTGVSALAGSMFG